MNVARPLSVSRRAALVAAVGSVAVGTACTPNSANRPPGRESPARATEPLPDVTLASTVVVASAMAASGFPCCAATAPSSSSASRWRWRRSWLLTLACSPKSHSIGIASSALFARQKLSAITATPSGTSTAECTPGRSLIAAKS